MTNIEAKLEVIIDRQHSHDRKLDNVVEILTGNGDPNKGVIVRLDRVEQDNVRGRRLKWAVLTSCLGVAGALVVMYFRGSI